MIKNRLTHQAVELFENEGFKELTPIQEEVYRHALKEKDIIAISQTGTGKTHAFLFPLANRLDPNSNTLQAIVIAPTRELSAQIYQFSQSLLEIMPDLRVELIVGGSDRQRMIDKLSNQPHLVIGTPGRIKDMFFEGVLRCEQASTVVLDEADMIWEYGFLEDVIDILTKMNRRVHMMVFSAVIEENLQPFIKKFMNHPLTIEIDSQSKLSPQIDHILIHKKHKSVEETLRDLLAVIEPSGCLIFANTRSQAHEIAEMMRDYGISTLELHGDMTPRERQRTLKSIQRDELAYLVASDIAARGIDLPQVSHVISLGFPKQLEFYIHRSGRTGRAGKSGTSFVLVDDDDKNNVSRLSSMGISFQYQAIRNKELVDVRSFYAKKRRQKKIDPEIAQILNRKNVKVKPNYKKKRKQQIQKLQQKKRREMIRQEINKQKKERAKANQKAKREE